MKGLFPVTLSEAEHRRRGKRLVGPISLTLQANAACMVIGPNGAGKTMLLKLIHGTVRLTGGDITYACDAQTARRTQAFVFQTPVMLRRSVMDNIAYPLRVRGIARRPARALSEDWADRVGLGGMLSRPATDLSGGERQKLAIARALITEPALLFLDEPTASLDGFATREIEAILRKAKADGTTLVMATHDMGQARRLGNRVLFLLSGQIVEDAHSESFFGSPQTPQAQAFLRGDIVT